VAEERPKIKSALDRALERFGAPETGPTLSSEQKQQLSEIGRAFKAKVTEQEFVFDERVRNALREGDFTVAEKIRTEKAEELRKLNAELEAEQEKVRQSG